MDEIEKKARAILAAEHEEDGDMLGAGCIGDGVSLGKPTDRAIRAICYAVQEAEQQRAEKLEMAAEATRLGEEVGRLKADLVDARSQMLAVWNFLKPNASNDMEWVDEILTALHERDALLHDAQRDAERYRFFCAAFNHPAQREWLARGFNQPHGEFNKSWNEIIDAAMAAEREGHSCPNCLGVHPESCAFGEREGQG